MNELPRPWRLMMGVASGVLLLFLGWAVWTLPEQAVGVGPLVHDRLDESGVANPVTAALLNFRAMDTLLELVVLVVALIGAWSLQVRQTEPLSHPPGPVLDAFARWLIPAMVLMGGYLLWAGAEQTGGAFQAGAVLGAAGVLWILVHGHLTKPSQRQLLRVAFVLGLIVFIGVGLATMAMNREFLDYPPGAAKTLIVIIETGSTISIALLLIGLFAGSQRGMEGELAPGSEEGDE
ncbi:MAG: hydrogen gas-evolving membrane-bound hydrogenase subunit E [Bradymonadaceae bacterium]